MPLVWKAPPGKCECKTPTDEVYNAWMLERKGGNFRRGPSPGYCGNCGRAIPKGDTKASEQRQRWEDRYSANRKKN